MKILITGAGGQLGRELQTTLPHGVELLARSRQELDIRDAARVHREIAGARPEVVINAAAYTDVDGAESDREGAMEVNRTGPRNLALACRELGCRLIHVSTDFVFDGTSPVPYRPEDPPRPLGAYGASKLAGELEVRQTMEEKAVVLRTAWVYSRFGSNFVLAMLRLMGEREEVRVVADQVGTPTWARGLAEVLWQFAGRPELSGVYHWTDAGVASWYDFAAAIRDEALALGLLARRVPVLPQRAADLPRPAARPSYGVLDKTATWSALEIRPLHWRSALKSMLREMKEQPDA